MWNSAFKTVILTSAGALISFTASGMDEGLSPFDWVKSETQLSLTSQNYINSGKRLSRAELMSLDAKLHAAYGEPTSIRRSVKIWEIANTQSFKGTASHTTIMCGIDQDGSQVFVVDARASTAGNTPSFLTRNKIRYSRPNAARQNTAGLNKLNERD